MARKTKSYYTTQYRGGPHFEVQKYTADLYPDGPSYKVNRLEGGGWVCNCVARKYPCRHVIMLEKFIEEGKVGQHGFYDYDNDRFFNPPEEANKNPWLNLEA